MTVVVYQLNRLLVSNKPRISLEPLSLGQIWLGRSGAIQTVFGWTSVALARFRGGINVVILLADHLNLVTRELVMSMRSILMLNIFQVDILPANCLINILICTCRVNTLAKDIGRLKNLLLTIYIRICPYILLIYSTIEVRLVIANIDGVIFLFATHLMVHIHSATNSLRQNVSNILGATYGVEAV